MHSLVRTLNCLALVTLVLLVAASTSEAQIPNPVLYLTHSEAIVINGKEYVRYNFDVLNKDKYPKDLFYAAPSLPPCGTNTKASRTWVDLYDQNGKRLYGFCNLSDPSQLSDIWFALESDVVPPSWVYVELTDRKTNVKYKSNLAETTQ